VDCVDIASMYLHPAFAVTVLVSVISLWRMKVNAVEDYETKLEQYPFWRQFLSDLLLPRALLTKRGKQWYVLGFINCIFFSLVVSGYIYFGKQDWVCEWGPKSTPTDLIKNAYKDS